MCYLVRQSQAEAERGGATTPPSLHSTRPRWAAAIAAALIGGVAVAALVGSPSTPPQMSAKEIPGPLATQAQAVPVTAAVQQGSQQGFQQGSQQGSAPVDDGVPTASDVVKAGMGDCHHGL